MGGYLTYTEYKDSGVEWLGEIPSHWQVVKFSHFINFQEGPGIMATDFKDEGVPLLRIANLKPGYVELEGCNYLDSEKVEKKWKHFRLDPNDLLISCSASTGLVSIVDKSSAGSIAYTGIIRLNPALPEIERDFIRILVSSEIFFTQIDLLKTGTTIQHYGPAHLRQIKITLPTLEEQRSIAHFLDYKTAQIDALIAKKEALLEKLAEKRTALISQAVTKGLDHTVSMKKSGIKWLDKVPTHWKVIKVRYCSEFVTSGSRGWSQYFSDDGSIFLRIANVSRQSIQLRLDDVQRVTPPMGSEGERAKAIPGDVIVSITADLGSVAVIPDVFETAYVSQHLALLRPLSNMTSGRWIAYQILSHTGKTQLLSSGYGGTKIQLSLTDIKDLCIALPPMSEQQAIESYLGNLINANRKMEDKVQQAIDKLKEYRTALITNAVTGKIDVRDVKLPELESVEAA